MIDRSLLVAGLAVLTAIAAVAWLRLRARNRGFGSRETKSLAALYDEVSADVGEAAFKETMIAFGKAFNIDPGLLRPDDSLESLGEIDSWDLGNAEDILQAWLLERGDPGVEHCKTVLDIAVAIQRFDESKNTSNTVS